MTILLGILLLHILVILRAKYRTEVGISYLFTFSISVIMVLYVLYMMYTMENPAPELMIDDLPNESE